MTDEQANTVIALLANILQRLDAYAQMFGASEDEGCPHPEDRRVDMSTFGDLNHWVCAVCRFDNKVSVES